MKRAKILAILLSASVVFTSHAVWADENIGITELSDSAIDEEGDENPENEDVKLTLQSEAEELQTLSEGEDYVANEAYFKAEDEESAERIAAEYGGEIESFDGGIAVVSFDRSVDEVINEAANADDANTAAIFPNYYMELADYDIETEASDPEISRQWAHGCISDNAAWNMGYTGEGVKVGVIDTGIDTDHEDLVDNLAEAVSSVKDKADDVEDINGHGTHVAGIIAETAGNAYGGAGIAPGAKIYSVKVGTSSTITIAAMLAGVTKAADAGCKVINMSLLINRTPSEAVIETMQETIDEAYNKGVTIVAAAGNKSSAAKYYPGALDHVISVASVADDGNLSSFSNYGDWVDIAAPGSSIYSTCVNNEYIYMSGTSMSAPVAAGVAALIYSSDDSLMNGDDAATADRVRDLILSTSDGRTYSYSGNTFDGGCIDLSKLFTGKKDDNEEPGGPEKPGNSEPSDPIDENDPENPEITEPDRESENDSNKSGGDNRNSVSNDNRNSVSNDNRNSVSNDNRNSVSNDNRNSVSNDNTENKGTDEVKKGENKDDSRDSGGDDKKESPDSPADLPDEAGDSVSADMVRQTVDIGGGGSATYYSSLPFTGKKLNSSDIDMSISYNGTNFRVTKFKVKNSKHSGTATATIKKLSTTDKEIVRAFKGKSFSIIILPRKVEEGEVSVSYSKSGELKKVWVKSVKVKKGMYSFDQSTGTVTFSGDYKGTVKI